MVVINSIVVDLILAAIFGGIIGFEREKVKQFAGLRTHMLICVGSTLLSIISISAFQGTVDPTRIIANIIVAVGFIGAGTIIAGGGNIHGLTTAASIWIVAIIGIVTALHYYAAAVTTVIITLVVLELWRLEIKLGLKKK